jgi:hypothetical protein
VVTVLELQVDFLCRHVHERDILEVLADTDNKD